MLLCLLLCRKRECYLSCWVCMNYVFKKISSFFCKLNCILVISTFSSGYLFIYLFILWWLITPSRLKKKKSCLDYSFKQLDFQQFFYTCHLDLWPSFLRIAFLWPVYIIVPNFIKISQELFEIALLQGVPDRQTNRQINRQTDRQENKVMTYHPLTIVMEAKTV